MKKLYENIGLLAIYLGAMLLVLGYFLDWTDSNAFLLIALFLVIAGTVAHIVMQKRNNRY